MAEPSALAPARPSAAYNSGTLNHAFHALYLCAYQEKGWETFLRHLVELFDGKAATFGVHVTSDRESNYRFSFSAYAPCGIVVDPMYTDKYSALDPFVGLPDGKAVTFRRFVPATTLRSCRRYLAYMVLRNVGDILGIDVVMAGEFEARLRISRSRNQEDFGDAEQSLCQSLVPHLQSAAALYVLHEKLIAERSLFGDSTGNLSTAAMFVDGTGRIAHMTERARTLLARLSCITINDGALVLPDPLATDRLQSAILNVLHFAASEPGASTRVTAPHFEHTLMIEVRALPSGPPLSREFKAALLLEVEGQADLPSVATIQRSMKITDAEAKLARQLAAGMSVAEAAATLGVRLSTVRSHLKSIFEKAGLHRQAQVVRAVLQSGSFDGR